MVSECIERIHDVRPFFYLFLKLEARISILFRENLSHAREKKIGEVIRRFLWISCEYQSIIINVDVIILCLLFQCNASLTRYPPSTNFYERPLDGSPCQSPLRQTDFTKNSKSRQTTVKFERFYFRHFSSDEV